MATYVIGDIQGCYKSFKALLKEIKFDPKKDRIIAAGDLVNRGPKSLEVLEWAMDHPDCFQSVLGNHDLYLLAVLLGVVPEKDKQYLKPIFTSSDRERIIDWLSSLRLMIREGNSTIVHAGLLPQWSIKDAQDYADEAHLALESKKNKDILKFWSDHKLGVWRDNLKGFERVATILNIFTLIRVCRDKNSIDFFFKDNPKNEKKGYVPWYKHPDRQTKAQTVIFGHWASLGKHVGDSSICIDTGCVWGNELTAIRLSDSQFFSVKARE